MIPPNPGAKMAVSHQTRASRRTFLKSTVAVAAVLPVFARQAFAASKQLHVYNWDTYIGPTTLDDFTKATGVEVRYDLYADNAELFARLREGNPGYDVICPGNEMVERMIKSDMLVPLDHAKIPNFANIDPRFMESPYDVGRKFSAPYFWGTYAAGYRKSAVEKALGSPTAFDSWKYLVGPESEKFAGRISWFSEPVSLIGSTLKYLGLPFNSTNMDDLKKAEAALMAAKKNVRAMAGDNGQDLLLAREVDLAMEANGDILQVMVEDDDLAYAYPKEGVQLWDDNWAIPKGGPNAAEAHDFINFIYTPEVHAEIAKVTQYALPNAAAKKLMPADYLNNPAVFPPDEVVKVSEYAKYVGEEVTSFYTDAVTRIRAE